MHAATQLRAVRALPYLVSKTSSLYLQVSKTLVLIVSKCVSSTCDKSGSSKSCTSSLHVVVKRAYYLLGHSSAAARRSHKIQAEEVSESHTKALNTA